ncbi:hypothetical protein AAG570_002575 [Ranatra chinensis]|uniref:Uncharacterized protein n=1 Tax=Ranatra chinensis TaxID=642074 RepID=A0ABD0Y7Y7_9HEMI
MTGEVLTISGQDQSMGSEAEERALRRAARLETDDVEETRSGWNRGRCDTERSTPRRLQRPLVGGSRPPHPHHSHPPGPVGGGGCNKSRNTHPAVRQNVAGVAAPSLAGCSRVTPKWSNSESTEEWLTFYINQDLQLLCCLYFPRRLDDLFPRNFQAKLLESSEQLDEAFPMLLLKEHDYIVHVYLDSPLVQTLEKLVH